MSVFLFHVDDQAKNIWQAQVVKQLAFVIRGITRNNTLVMQEFGTFSCILGYVYTISILVHREVG
jgi:hypothetical protein